uniref:Uncharacterized protein n=1 Tax=viral metagenome TaxID=1070528 RepID=A0A6C0F4T6_9ZZZZ|tara:strand:- start:6640 stop:6978 length:339 start_codon:yes stop_codon:yes gene_type:complete
MQDEGEEPDNEGEDIDTNDEGMTQQEIQDVFNDPIQQAVQQIVRQAVLHAVVQPMDPNQVNVRPYRGVVGVGTTGGGYRKKRSRKRTKRASKRRSKRVRRKTRRRKKSKRRR